MGKSARSKKRKREASEIAQPTAHWKENDIAEALAYLDYGVGEQLPAAEILKGASEYLFQHGSQSFTARQIDQKLYRLFRNHGRDDFDKKDFPLVYKIGSRAFKYFEESADLALISQKLAAIKTAKEEEFVDSPRKLRSESRTPGAGTLVRVRRTILAKRLRKARTRNGTTGVAVRETRDVVTENLESADSRDAIPVIKAESIRAFSQTSGAADAVAFSGEFERNTPSPDEGTMDVVGETPSPTPLCPIQPSSVGSHTSTEDGSNQTPLKLHLEQTASFRQDSRALEQKLDVERVEDQEKLYWEDRSKSAETGCQRLREENGTLRYQTEIAFGPDGLATLDRMLRTDQRVADLNKRLRQLESVRFSELPRPQLPRLDLREVEVQHQDIVCRLASIFNEQDFIDDLVRLDIGYESDLHALCRKAQVLEIPTATEHDKMPLKFSADVQVVARALLAAALSSWVLEADMRDLFPDLGFGSRFKASRRLFEKFWGLLTSRDAIFAKTVELSAHKELFGDEFFHDFVLPRKANALAQRAIDALVPLFRQGHSESGILCNKSVVSESDRDRLIDAFTQALKLRCHLLLSDDTFMCALYPRGTPFRPDLMSLAQESVIPGEGSSQYQDAVVAMTVVPGLRRIKSHRQRVSYAGFQCVNDPDALGRGCLIRAVVVLRSS